jgi:hypothetical protein
LLWALDRAPLRDEILGAAAHVLERPGGVAVRGRLREQRPVHGADRAAGNFAEVAAAMNDEVIDGAGLESTFAPAAAEHQGAGKLLRAGVRRPGRPR